VTTADEAAQARGFIDARGRREFIQFGIAALFASLLNAHMALLSIVFGQAGHNLQAIGLLLSLFAVPVLVVTVVAGPVAARLGSLATARLAILLMIAGFGSLALTSENFAAALVSRLIHGIGFGLYLPSIMTYGQSRLNQLRFVGLVITFSSLIPFSYALGPAMGEFMLETYGPTAFFLGALAPASIGRSAFGRWRDPSLSGWIFRQPFVRGSSCHWPPSSSAACSIASALPIWRPTFRSGG
jgi:MFS family permease